MHVGVVLVAVGWLELGAAFPLSSAILLEASWMTAIAGVVASVLEFRKTGRMQAFVQLLLGLAQLAVMPSRWLGFVSRIVVW